MGVMTSHTQNKNLTIILIIAQGRNRIHDTLRNVRRQGESLKPNTIRAVKSCSCHQKRVKGLDRLSYSEGFILN